MIRTIRIFNLHFMGIFQQRARSFVWFLIALFNPLILLLYWNGTNLITPSLVSYYLFLIIASGCLESHTEEDISDNDIKAGKLVRFILKPYSYYWMKFFDEYTYRLSQGFFGVLAFIIIVFFIHPHLTIADSLLKIVLSLVIWVLAYVISFTYKMILGMVTFWTTDIGGLFQVADLVMIVFGGYIMPLLFMPTLIQTISKSLPFSYIIYYPVAAISNQLDIVSLLRVIVIQLIWVIAFYLLYVIVWKKGVKQFTGVGQ